jgi:hypothetical protein
MSTILRLFPGLWVPLAAAVSLGTVETSLAEGPAPATIGALAYLQADPFETPAATAPPASPPASASAADVPAAPAAPPTTSSSPPLVLGEPYHGDPELSPYRYHRSIYDYGYVSPAATIQVQPYYSPFRGPLGRHPVRWAPVRWYKPSYPY